MSGVVYALHVAKANAPPLTIWKYMNVGHTPSPGPGPVEAMSLMLGQWGHRRGKAAGSFIPGASKLTGEDIDRMVKGGRMNVLTEEAWRDAWRIDTVSTRVYVPRELVGQITGAPGSAGDPVMPEPIVLPRAIALVKITRPGGTYLDVQDIADFDLPSQHRVLAVRGAFSAAQFERTKAAEKKFTEYVEDAEKQLARMLASEKLLTVDLNNEPFDREHITKALGAEAKRAMEREAAERAAAEAAALRAAEEERIKNERLARNPAAGMSDDDLASQLRRLREGKKR